MTVAPTRDELKRAALFIPCESQEHLKRWIRVFLGIDVPDTTICDDDVTNPASNSNPMALIWEIYSKALQGNDPNFQRILAYAARDSFKTVSCSILEILCLFHLRRNVAHMAAIESQAQKCGQYIEKYLERPILRDYLTSKNKRMIEVSRFEGYDGSVLSPKQWGELSEGEQQNYRKVSYYMKILVATMAGANSEHVPMLVLDELDLAPEKPFKEALMIPAPGERGELPMTFMTSSRKFSFGLVQKEIDNAKDTNLTIRHWNLIDVTAACPKDRHLPDEPRVPVFYSENLLRALPEQDYELLSQEEKKSYSKAEGYAGCLRNCSLFAVCRGRLATKQTSRSPLLKSVAHTTTQFRTFAKDVDIAKAQLMCWKPSSEGLIYPHLSRDIHMLSPARMAEEITGERFSPHFSKAELINLMISRGMQIHAGMDFGFTHNFAVVVGALDGNRLFIFHVIAVSGFELMQRIDLCNSQVRAWSPLIYPDPAYPSDIKSFKKAGFRMKSFTKDVLMGISSVRSKIMPSLGQAPEIFFLGGDPLVDLLFTRMTRYHWKIDAAGNPTDEPDDTDDDECDAVRYLCQNLFGKKMGADKRRVDEADVTNQAVQDGSPSNLFMRDKIRSLTSVSESSPPALTNVIRKGSFYFGV